MLIDRNFALINYKMIFWKTFHLFSWQEGIQFVFVFFAFLQVTHTFIWSSCHSFFLKNDISFWNFEIIYFEIWISNLSRQKWVHLQIWTRHYFLLVLTLFVCPLISLFWFLIFEDSFVRIMILGWNCEVKFFIDFSKLDSQNSSFYSALQFTVSVEKDSEERTAKKEEYWSWRESYRVKRENKFLSWKNIWGMYNLWVIYEDNWNHMRHPFLQSLWTAPTFWWMLSTQLCHDMENVFEMHHGLLTGISVAN